MQHPLNKNLHQNSWMVCRISCSCINHIKLGKSELKHFFRDYHKKRIQKKIKVKLIANEKIKTIFIKHHLYKNMKVKFTKQKLPTGIFIYEDYVMTVVWIGDPTAFVIKSKNNAEKYKEFFLEMWKTAIS